MADFDLDSVLRSILNGDPVPPGATMTAPTNPTPAPTVTKVVTPEQPAIRDAKLAEMPPLRMPEFTTDEIAEQLDIRNYATMAKLRVRKWHARVKDKRVARDTAHAEDASEGAFSVYKRLLAGAEDKLKAVHSAIDAARMRHYEMTLPWSTTGLDESGRRDGPRLLPNTLFMEYVATMSDAQRLTQESLDEFVGVYPTLIEAARRHLGKSFDATQYPPESHIRDHFALEYDFQPIPTGVDFKGLPQQQITRLAEHMNRNTRKCLENAMRDVWARLHEVVTNMAERLKDPQQKFHDTLVTNVRETVAMAKHLNPTGDSRMSTVIKTMEDELCVEDAKTLRENLRVRERVAGSAIDVLASMAKCV